MDLSRQRKLLRHEIPPVLVVGAGATGFHVVHQLAGLGAPLIHVWDMDDIEESNLNRQLYGASRIGQNKATALCEMVNAISPQNRDVCFAEPRELDPFMLTINEVDDFPVVINATDNLYHHGIMLKKLLLLLSEKNFVYLSPRMAGFEAEVFVMVSGLENEFVYYHTKEEWEAIRDSRQSCTSGGAQFNPSIITTSVVLAAVTVQQIINILNGENVHKWLRLELDSMKIVAQELYRESPRLAYEVVESEEPEEEIDTGGYHDADY